MDSSGDYSQEFIEEELEGQEAQQTRNHLFAQDSSQDSTIKKEIKGSINMFNRELESNMNIIENKDQDENDPNAGNKPLDESLGSSINSEKNKVTNIDQIPLQSQGIKVELAIENKKISQAQRQPNKFVNLPPRAKSMEKRPKPATAQVQQRNKIMTKQNLQQNTGNSTVNQSSEVQPPPANVKDQLKRIVSTQNASTKQIQNKFNRQSCQTTNRSFTILNNNNNNQSSRIQNSIKNQHLASNRASSNFNFTEEKSSSHVNRSQIRSQAFTRSSFQKPASSSIHVRASQQSRQTLSGVGGGGSGRNFGVEQLRQSTRSAKNLQQQSVKKMKIADYYEKKPNGKEKAYDCLLGINQKEKTDFSIQILDNIIQIEEQMYGFSLFNRGSNLQKSLIDPSKVSEYIQKQKCSQPSQPIQTNLILNQATGNELVLRQEAASKDQDDDWKSMMEYFKKNPAALLDAIPTPREEEEQALADFRSGLTPKKGAAKMSFLDTFNNRSSKNLINQTPKSNRRLASPKVGLLSAHSKLAMSSSKNLIAGGQGGPLRQSSSRQSLRNTPRKNSLSFCSTTQYDAAKVYGHNDNQASFRKIYQQDPQRDFRIKRTNRNLTSAKSQGQGSRLQKRSNLQHSQIQQKRLQLQEQQQKVLNERKMNQERIRSKLQRDYQEGQRKQVVPVTAVKRKLKQEEGEQSQMITSQSIMSNKQVLEDLDWKKSRLYTVHCVNEVPSRMVFEKDAKLFKEDELDFIQRQVKEFQGGKKTESERVMILTPLIQKALNTLNHIHLEILQEQYSHLEQEPLAAQTYNGDKYLQMMSLLQKIREMFVFRGEILEFLQKIHLREKCLSEMKETVMNIEHEDEIDNLGKDHLMKFNVFMPTRARIAELGEKLVNSTRDILKGLNKFTSTFNKAFEYVKIETLVFEEADYVFVSQKEVEEIREIFRSFDIEIKPLWKQQQAQQI